MLNVLVIFSISLSIDDIVKEIQSPRHFTAKILQNLSKHNIISSVKGPNGGFFISPKQAKVNLLTLVKIIDGSNSFAGCILGLSECHAAHPCPMHEQYQPIREKMILLLSNNNIEDLTESLLANSSFLSPLDLTN